MSDQVIIQQRVSSVVTIDAEGMARMDRLFWMDYSKRATRYYNALLQIVALDDPGEDRSPEQEIAWRALQTRDILGQIPQPTADAQSPQEGV